MKKFLFITYFSLFCGISAYSQAQVKISGHIYHLETNEQIPFANIRLMGTNFGTVSDQYGSFVFLVPEQEEITIKISSIGFESQTLTCNKDPLIVYMKPSLQVLNEIVVSATVEEPRKIVKRAFRSVRKNYFR